MKTFVVDTSALVRLYVPDGPVPDGLEEAVDLAWCAEALLLAPELALAEAAQVLRKKERAGLLSTEESDTILDEIVRLPLELAGHRELLESAVDLARKRDITVYDALFLALADARHAVIITADAKLRRPRSRRR